MILAFRATQMNFSSISGRIIKQREWFIAIIIKTNESNHRSSCRLAAFQQHHFCKILPLAKG